MNLVVITMISAILHQNNCLFGSIKLTKNNDINKYKYLGYGIGFDGTGYFFVGNEIGRNVIIFGADSDKKNNFSSWKSNNHRIRWPNVIC